MCRASSVSEDSIPAEEAPAPPPKEAASEAGAPSPPAAALGAEEEEEEEEEEGAADDDEDDNDAELRAPVTIFFRPKKASNASPARCFRAAPLIST